MTADESRPWQGAAGITEADDNISIAAGPNKREGLRSVAPAAQLLAQHRSLLEAAGIPVEFALRLGVHSVATPAQLPAELRWTADHTPLPALVFPWHGPDGVVSYQLRPDTPVQMVNEAMPRKYIQGPGVHLLNVLGDQAAATRVWIVEGTKQCLAAAAYAPQDALVVGIPGCANGMADGFILPGLAQLVEDLPCVVVFDADVATNPDVWNAAKRLGDALKLEGATQVAFAELPGGAKRGLDDLLGQRAPDKRARFLGRLLASASKQLPRCPPAKIQDNADDPRPRIDVAADRLAVVQATVGALVARWNGWRLFNHGEVISVLEGHRTFALDKGRLMKTLAETARFYAPSRQGPKSTWPDNGVIEAVTASADQFRQLERVSRVPFVRPDGTICQDPGYDVASRTALVLDDEALGPIQVPEYPSPKQVERALELLRSEWLGDFPLRTDADRANLLALILTPFIRGLVPLVPLAVIDGLQMGVGKNLLADCLSIVATGRSADPLPYPSDDEETRKLITAAFGTGADLFVFDEAHVIEGRSLARALTATTWIDRILGVSRVASYPNAVTWVALGNNVQIRGDLVRRVYRIALHPAEPNPENRAASSFRHPDLRAWTLANRASLVEAALTLVRAWVANGRPAGPRAESFGSFEAWERVVGGILHLAGVEDFLANTRPWRLESDYETGYWTEHLAQLQVAFPVQPFTTAEATSRLRTGAITEAPPGLEDSTARTFPRELGKAYGRVADRWFGVLRIVRAGTRGAGGASGGVNRWQIETRGAGPVRSVGSVGSPAFPYVKEVVPSPLPASPALPVAGSRHSIDPIDPTCSAGAVAICLYTGDEKQLFIGAERPYLHLLAWQQGDDPPETTTDPAVMRRVLAQAPALLTCDGLGLGLLAAARHLSLDHASLGTKCRDLSLEARLADPPADPNVRDCYDLSSLARQRLGAELDGKPRRRITPGEQLEAARRDVGLLHRLAAVIEPPDRAYSEREARIAAVAAAMTLAGLRVDEALLRARHADRLARDELIRGRLIDEYGFPSSSAAGNDPSVHPWATRAGGEAFLALALAAQPDWPRTPDGSPVLRTAQLRRGIQRHPRTPLAEVCELIAEGQAGSSFLASAPTNLVSGRVHPIYSLDTVTGRWASTRPNILGVGKRTAALLADRDVILAEPGCVFIGVDLAGIDARCVAGLSGDVAYARLFEPGVDIHAEMASLFLADRSRREEAKAISHGINYGRGPAAIAAQTGQPLDEVTRMHAAYFNRYVGIANWHREVRERGAAGGLLPTGTGRLVRVTPANAYTEAPARLAQAAARDLAMTGVLKLVDAGLGPALFIHDEVVVCVPADHAEETAARVAELMSFDWTSPSGLVIPIVAEPSQACGPRWSDLYRRETSP